MGYKNFENEAAYQRHYRATNPERKKQWAENRKKKLKENPRRKKPLQTPEERAARYKRHAEFMRGWHRKRKEDQ